MDFQSFVAIGVTPSVAIIAWWLNQRVRAAEQKAERAREDLASYKEQVAQHYASISYLKDVENRLFKVLVRIEERLDHRHSE